MSGDDCDCESDILSPDYCCPSCGKDFCGTCEEGNLHGPHGEGTDEVCEECCNERTGCPDLKEDED